MVPAVSPARYPRRAGHRVTPWIDGMPFYQRLQAAAEQATTRFWGVISFVQPDFCLPDGTLFWHLMARCAARGVDVRLLFWRNPQFSMKGHIFQGDAADRALLSAQCPAVRARWDASPDAAHCHHQKAWLVDEVGFVGGMVLSTSTLATPDHAQGKHDVFAEVTGPAVADVAANFIERWNHAGDPWPSGARADDLPAHFPIPAPAGRSRVQLTRTVRPGLYGGAAGEGDIHTQYRLAFAAARHTIYIENQHPGEIGLLTRLAEALERGVRVVFVVPGEPMAAIRQARTTGARRYRETFDRLAALAEHPRFTLAALATHGHEIYTHAKLCIVDGQWTTIGSANLVDLSLCHDHTELNLAAWDRGLATQLLGDLFAEHTGEAPPRGDRARLRRLQVCARANTQRRARGLPQQGHLYALDPRSYALDR